MAEPFSAEPGISHADMVAKLSGGSGSDLAPAKPDVQAPTVPQPQPISVDDLTAAVSSAVDPAQEPESLLDPAVRVGVLQRLDQRSAEKIANVPPPIEVKSRWPVVPRSAGSISNKQPVS